jgi:hypothetical protein
VVIVGQRKALYLAVRDWRRAPRHTGLGRLLGGTLRFAWEQHRLVGNDTHEDRDISAWEGLGDGMLLE